MAARTDIDTTSVAEHTEWVEPAEFPDTIATFADDKDETAKESNRHTDGSAEYSF